MVSNDAVASLFIASNMRAQHICSAGLPYFSLGYVFFTLNIVIIGFFQGTERPRQATLFMLLRGCIFLVPLYLRLPRIAGVHGLKRNALLRGNHLRPILTGSAKEPQQKADATEHIKHICEAG